MRKKPDILLVLAVLVVTGVLLSNFVLFADNKKNVSVNIDKRYDFRPTSEQVIKAHFKSYTVADTNSKEQQIR